MAGVDGVIHTQDADFTLICADVLDGLRSLEDGSVHCVVTSPPYLDARSEYDSPTAWDEIFAALERVVTGPMLWNVGRIWRNGIERLWWTDLVDAAAESGWEHWDTEVWAKSNANPIHGRVLTNAHEYVLIFGRDGVRLNTDAVRTEYDPETLARFQRRYVNGTGVKGDVRERDGRKANEAGARANSFFIANVGREKGNIHPAPMAEEMAEHLVLLSTWALGQTVLDPFLGSGTTAYVARKHGRRSIGIELNPAYADLAARRMQQQSLLV